MSRSGIILVCFCFSFSHVTNTQTPGIVLVVSASLSLCTLPTLTSHRPIKVPPQDKAHRCGARQPETRYWLHYQQKEEKERARVRGILKKEGTKQKYRAKPTFISNLNLTHVKEILHPGKLFRRPLPRVVFLAVLQDARIDALLKDFCLCR